jgi:hypothetical protein
MARTPTQSKHLKKRFLEHFARIGIITRAAEEVGLNRNTIRYWQEHDDQFALAFQLADVQATEVLEAEARRRAVEGVERLKFDRGQPITDPETGEPYREREYSDTLLIFLLKARAPEKYRERQQIEHVGSGGGPIEVDIAERDRRLAALAELARERAVR